MSTLALWGIILGGMAATYTTRLSFLVIVPHDRLPQLARRALRFVPPAVLAAIILPELIRPGGTLDLSLGNDRWIAGIVAALVAWRFRNTWLTIGAGMIALWGLSAIH